MASATSFYFALPAAERPSSPIALNEQRVPDYQWFDDNRSRGRGANPVSAVTTVVIHATAGYATQHALDNWRTRQASAHWIVPDEDEDQHGEFVWAVVSETLGAFHVKNSMTHSDIGGVTGVNKYSLGIEIVNTQDVQNYTDSYSDWQVQQTAMIVRYAWAKYPNLQHVISHARLDPANRGDPGSNFPWDDFRALVFSGASDVGPLTLAANTTPIGNFPHIDPKKGGGCCP
jgi:N-acetyl-anhydromuramyl-L-alanine amidase AmpD